MAQKWQTISELAADTSQEGHTLTGGMVPLSHYGGHDFIKPTILTISF